MTITKILKLMVVAFSAALVMIAVLFATDKQKLRQAYLCWKQAVSLTSCYRGDHFDFVANLGGVKYEGNTGDFLENKMFYDGAFEKPILFLMRDIMGAVYGPSGTFIDIGANTGQHSLFMSRHAKAVHAFEPWEPVLKKFRCMVELNRIENITIHAYGLGNENGKKPFFRPPSGEQLTGSFDKGFRSDNSYEGDLEIHKGDEAFEKAQIKSVSIIKIDIESYEKLALLGLQATLNRYRPIVVFEVTIDQSSPVTIKSKNELTNLFPEKYEFAVISEKSDASTGAYLLDSMDAVSFDHAEQHDLIAYPLERKDSIPRRGPNR